MSKPRPNGNKVRCTYSLYPSDNYTKKHKYRVLDTPPVSPASEPEPEPERPKGKIKARRDPYDVFQPDIDLNPNGILYRAMKSIIVPIRSDKPKLSKTTEEKPSFISTICDPPSFYEEPGSSLRKSLLEVIPENIPDREFPETLMYRATKKIRSEDWEEVMKGIQMAIGMVRNHPTILERKEAEVCEFCWICLPHLCSGRVMIIRAALIFYKDIIPLGLKAVLRCGQKITEKILDKCVTKDHLVLGEAEACLMAYIKVTTEPKAFRLLLTGFIHKNVHVRKSVVMLLNCLIDRMGELRFANMYSKTAMEHMAEFLEEARVDVRSSMQDTFRRLAPYPMFRYHCRYSVSRDRLYRVAKSIDLLIVEAKEKCAREGRKWEKDMNPAGYHRQEFDWFDYSNFYNNGHIRP